MFNTIDYTSIRIKDIANVNLGPAPRIGILDKEGAEVVGGVVTARYGANPMEVINNVKDKLEELKAGLPSKELSDGTISQLTVVPFYDRSELIKETLNTLDEALSMEVLITIFVIIIMVFNLRASILISGLLPVAVLMVFIAMKFFNVDANLVALSGIAIAICTDRKSTRLNSSHVSFSYAVFYVFDVLPPTPPFPTRRSSDLSLKHGGAHYHICNHYNGL